MYLIWIREMEGRERMLFEGVVATVKQANYTYRALCKYHPEELILEYELVDEQNRSQVFNFIKEKYHAK